ncbi:glycosyltransferase [Stenotrophomonas sp. NPDC047960]|uniref:glycosyltransferase n=1 Tax=Stenotrophomonas sp. NPDC047960 TaxID=3364531 RepID=UPI003715F8CC
MFNGNSGLKRDLKRVAAKVLSINWFRLVPNRIKLHLVRRAGVCDWHWYARHALGRRTAFLEGPSHFISFGNAEGRSPSPLFDPAWYCARFGLRASPLDALTQYVLIGDWIGLSPSPWFDTRYSRAGAKKAAGIAVVRPQLGRYLADYRETAGPHPLFDQDWYLDEYPDVRASGANPLVHFLYDGLSEGRLPNPYFDPEWYREAHPDIGEGNAFSHFVLYGAAEGRSPGPEFNSRQYLDANPDVAATGMNALAHYLAIGRQNGRELGKRPLSLTDLLVKRIPEAPLLPPGVVDIILPVYRDLVVTRNCVESVLRSKNQTATRLHIYNDRSPEPEVTAYLRDVAAANPSVHLVENVENLGFVRTVNAGMAHVLEHRDSLGALLLNSDTIVSADWVDRMVAHMRPSVGSITALSNNATICSYPNLGANPLPEGMDAGTLDALARETNAGVSVEIPTGVGFCMLISRSALETAGLFDAEAFGKGYGEENDFCMRSAKFGFRHRLAMDVFVEHVGEVSFADDSKPGKVIAQRVIDERYPDYGAQVARFCSMDPGFAARMRLTLAVWKKRAKPAAVLLTHSWGGGTERAVQAMAVSLGQTHEVVVIRPIEDRSGVGEVRVSRVSEFDGFDFLFRYHSPDELASLLHLLEATTLQIHHLVGFGASVRRAVSLSKIPFSFHVHDNYAICPQIMLTNAEGNYCGEPDAAGCDACIAQRPSNGASDIRNWRVQHEWALLGAQQVIAPSKDAAARMQRYTGVPVIAQYHEVDVGDHPVTFGAGAKPYRVLLLGVMAPHKGLNQLNAIVEESRRVGNPMQFHLIGYPQVNPVKDVGFTWSGAYEEEELDDLIARYNPDAFLFISQAPETYSYTLSHALRTGRPIAGNRLGAFTERLVDVPNALLLAHDASARDVVRSLSNWLDGLYSRELV